MTKRNDPGITVGLGVAISSSHPKKPPSALFIALFHFVGVIGVPFARSRDRWIGVAAVLTSFLSVSDAVRSFFRVILLI